ncbi:MAG: AI-2E family transporter [Actinomycetota bacterium]|jgi:predicted PurR-regulated permease PerM|nr:AI-2E family transporter [Actinomycetota bacterium]
MRKERWARRPRGKGREGKSAFGGHMTPIPVSSRVWIGIVVVGLALFALLLYAAPTVPAVALGGVALAIVLSFPVRALSHFMPRGLAILLTVLAMLGLISLGFFFLVPLLIEQLSTLVRTTPRIANSANQLLLDVINALNERQLVPGSDPEEFARRLVNDLFDRAQNLTENLLRSLLGFIPRAFNFGVTLFGILFVAIYLLVDVRKVKAALLKSVPAHYRHDARDLWEAFGESLSRYLGGLVFVVMIQGVLAAAALYLLGVRYAILLGVWVSVTAIIPYLGAFLGGIPAVIVALVFGSPNFESSTTTAILTIVAYVLIQQLEGNFLTPRIQGQALHVHPILVLLAVIAGGELAGLAGVVFAVPALAVFRVLFDFFRVRLRRK